MKARQYKELEIKRGIPIPPRERTWPLRSPITKALVKMVTGDCIDIPIQPGQNKNTMRASIVAKGKIAKAKIVLRCLRNSNSEFFRVWKLKQLP
jgi:hypothetical protein